MYTDKREKALIGHVEEGRQGAGQQVAGQGKGRLKRQEPQRLILFENTSRTRYSSAGGAFS